MLHLEKIPVDTIIVGDRIRNKLTGIEELAASIKKIGRGKEDAGLLQNIVVKPDNTLLMGRRRLAAVVSLGWKQMTVIVADNPADEEMALLMEYSENTCRSNFTPREASAFAKRMKAFSDKRKAEEKAANPQPSTKPKRKPAGTKPKGKKDKTEETRADSARPDDGEKKKTPTQTLREEVKAATGFSHDTIIKVQKIEEAAKAQPEIYSDLAEALDEQSVNATYAEFEARKIANGDRAYVAEAFCKRINGYTRQLDAMIREFEELKPNPLSYDLHWQSFIDLLANVRKKMHVNRPYRTCPYCNNTLKHLTTGKDCQGCGQTGYVGETNYRSGCKAMGIPEQEIDE